MDFVTTFTLFFDRIHLFSFKSLPQTFTITDAPSFSVYHFTQSILFITSKCRFIPRQLLYIYIELLVFRLFSSISSQYIVVKSFFIHFDYYQRVLNIVSYTWFGSLFPNSRRESLRCSCLSVAGRPN